MHENDAKSKRVEKKSNAGAMKFKKSNDKNQELKVIKSNVYENGHEEDIE